MPIMNMTNHQGISWPSQAKNLPLSCLFALLMMLKSFWTENFLVNSLPSGMFLWNGLERSVSTVPGCNKMHMIGSFFRANSTDTVFVTASISWKEHNSSSVRTTIYLFLSLLTMWLLIHVCNQTYQYNNTQHVQWHVLNRAYALKQLSE